MKEKCPLLLVSNAGFHYGSQVVFQNLSFQVERGQIFCLIGRNGCGKTTLLDCLLGVYPLSGGEIFIEGLSSATYSTVELAKKISYVPQLHKTTFPYLVKEIILMGRTVHNRSFASPGKEDQIIAIRVMEELHIQHLKDRPYTQLSGGELQLVMLARALVQDTPLIVMDEPTVHLDYYHELHFLEILVDLIKQQSKTIILSSHNPNQTFFLEKKGVPVRIGLMANGHFKALGKPSKVLSEETLSNVYSIEAKVIKAVDQYQILPIGTERRARDEREI